jgi:hypothetical protein
MRQNTWTALNAMLQQYNDLVRFSFVFMFEIDFVR